VAGLPARGAADCRTWCFDGSGIKALPVTPTSKLGTKPQTVAGIRFTSTGAGSGGMIGLRPVIQVLGSNPLVITNRDSPFTDGGASCVDSFDGDVSERVQAEGEMVDLRRPGRYTLTYSCSNLRGVDAKPVVKTVSVVPFKGECACDNSCPYARDGHCMDAGPGSFGTSMVCTLSCTLSSTLSCTLSCTL
jgi:hypothetical protein